MQSECGELELPAHIYYDQLEEAMLLHAFRLMATYHDVSVPPALSMAAVNDIVEMMALHVLPGEAHGTFLKYNLSGVAPGLIGAIGPAAPGARDPAADVMVPAATMLQASIRTR